MNSENDLEMGESSPKVMEMDSECKSNSSVDSSKSSSSVDSYDNERYVNGKLVFGVYCHWTPPQGPHQVFVDVDIEQLDRIDTVNQTFTSSFTVTQSWLWSEEDEEHFNSIETDSNKLQKDVDDTEQNKFSWQPNPLTFPNAEMQSLEIHSQLGLRKYNQLMMVEKKTIVSGDFGEKFELDSFPFDCQDFRIEIAWSDSEHVCKISPNPLKENFITLKLHSMIQRSFRIYEPIVQLHMKPIKGVSKEMTNITNYHPTMQIYLKGERYWGPYVWQIILMMILMSASSLSVFTLELESGGDRLAAITTVFLTKVAFQFALSTLLPRLSYLTIIDEYIFACMVFTFSIGVQTSITSYITTHTNMAFDVSTFNIMLIANSSILLVGNTLFALYVYLKVLPKEKLKLVSCIWDPQSKNEEKHVDRNELKLIKTTLRSTSNFKEFEVTSWFAVKMPGHGNFIFYGENTVKLMVEDMHIKRLNVCPSLETSAISKISRSDVFSYFNQFQGIWSADYGHGIELFCSRIVIEKGSPKVCFTKITGDPNVPAGRISFKTEGVPVVGSNTSTKGFLQIRGDITNPNGFSWEDIEIEFPSPNSITYLWFRINHRCTLTRLETATVHETASELDTLE